MLLQKWVPHRLFSRNWLFAIKLEAPPQQPTLIPSPLALPFFFPPLFFLMSFMICCINPDQTNTSQCCPDWAYAPWFAISSRHLLLCALADRLLRGLLLGSRRWSVDDWGDQCGDLGLLPGESSRIGGDWPGGSDPRRRAHGGCEDDPARIERPRQHRPQQGHLRVERRRRRPPLLLALGRDGRGQTLVDLQCAGGEAPQGSEEQPAPPLLMRKAIVKKDCSTPFPLAGAQAGVFIYCLLLLVPISPRWRLWSSR